MTTNKPVFIFGLAVIFWGLILLYSVITDTKSYKDYGTYKKTLLLILALFAIGALCIYIAFNSTGYISISFSK